jgi:tRNA(Ile)-lysidine synthase
LIQIQGKLHRDIYIACSGGVDSMAVVDFLRRNHNCTLLFFDHGTETSRDARSFLEDYVATKNSEFQPLPNATTLSIRIGEISNTKSKADSWEEYWRKERYRYFNSFNNDIVTCHHLDDCVETWIWSSMHGEGKIIPYQNQNVFRPFRLNRKKEFVNWCRSHSVPWIEDTTNEDTKFMRNYIRKELVNKCLVVNPGLHKVIRKKVMADYSDEQE